MRKSETGPALPLIRTQRARSYFPNNTKTPRSSLFIERVKQQVQEQSVYQQMPTHQLSQQQVRLKQLLRQFNHQTHSVLADFIEVQPRKTPKKRTHDSTYQLQTKLKDIENQTKMMELCQNELNTLTLRCQNLKYMNKQEMQRQIVQVKRRIEQLRTNNKELDRQVTLNGLNCCRGEKFNMVKQLEYDKAQTDIRKVQLTKNAQEQQNDITSFQQKIVAADQQIPTLEADYKEAVDKEKGSSKEDQLRDQQRDKIKHIQYMKQRQQGFVGALKQRYLTKLHLLDQASTRVDKNAEQIGQKDEGIARTKQQLIVLEHQLSAKKNSPTISLLQSNSKK